MKKRVCIIGAGPSGVSVVKHFDDLDPEVRPEVICFERKGTWGGQWNYEWRTGTDEFGEPTHSSVYKGLWINSPKESLELPYYTFDEHFGKPYRSYLTRPEVWNYLNGAWSKFNLSSYIKFQTAVRYVKYNQQTNDFMVTYKDLVKDETSDETFTHVIVASGIFHIPNKPAFPGIADFKGDVIHSHDVRDIKRYKGQRLLLIGNGYTSHDIAMMGLKYGVKDVTISWRTRPDPVQWPAGITIRPLVKKVESNKVHFVDRSSDEFDSIILCTGYQVKFPFMDKGVCQGREFSYYPYNLYKGSLFTEGGNNKVFYIGDQYHLSAFSIFDFQALWICRYIQGTITGEPASREEMRKDMDKWAKKTPKFIGDIIDGSVFEIDYMYDLAVILNYNHRIKDMLELLSQAMHAAIEDPLGFRNYCYRSIYTGTVAIEPEVPWVKDLTDNV